MYIKFIDSEKNLTYLKINEKYTYEELVELCTQHFAENGERDEVDEMTFIDFCIKKQYMTILTDEEASDVEKQIKDSKKKSKTKKKNIDEEIMTEDEDEEDQI